MSEEEKEVKGEEEQKGEEEKKESGEEVGEEEGGEEGGEEVVGEQNEENQGSETKVFVNNLAWRVDWRDLKEKFGEIGEVGFANVFMHYGRSKGCGIVEFTNPEDAKKAIEVLNETEYEGRKIYVREDRGGREPRRGGGGGGRGRGGGGGYRGNRGGYGYGGGGGGGYRGNYGGGGYGGGGRRGGYGGGGGYRGNRRNDQEATPSAHVFIGSLSFQTQEDSLNGIVSKFGTVESCEIPTRDDGSSKGYALVKFESQEQAAQCIDGLNETEVDGRRVIVRYDLHLEK